MRSAALSSLMVVLIACDPPDPPIEPLVVTGQAGEIELGLGDHQVFEPIAENEDVQLTAGSQGGFHLPLTMRVRGFAAGEEVKVERSARRAEDGALVSKYEYRTNLAPMAEDGVTALEREVPMFMCPTPIGVSVLDARIEVKVTISGAAGLAETILHFQTRCPEDGTASFCREICAG